MHMTYNTMSHSFTVLWTLPRVDITSRDSLGFKLVLSFHIAQLHALRPSFTQRASLTSSRYFNQTCRVVLSETPANISVQRVPGVSHSLQLPQYPVQLVAATNE